MNYATAVNDAGEIALFIDPQTVAPDAYHLDAGNLVLFAGAQEIGACPLDETAFEAATLRPDGNILVFETDGAGNVLRSGILVSDGRHRTPRRGR